MKDFNKFVECALRKYNSCIWRNKLSRDDPVYVIALECLVFCINKSRTKPFHLEACFKKCNEKSVPKSRKRTKKNGGYTKKL